MATPASKQSLAVIHDGEKFKVVNTKTGKTPPLVKLSFATKEEAEQAIVKHLNFKKELLEERQPETHKGVKLVPVEGKKTYKFKLNEYLDPNSPEREMSLSAARKFINENIGKAGM